MNSELARQRAIVLAARARIHAGTKPDPGIQLRRPAPAVKKVARVEAATRELGVQHADHVRAWERVLRARRYVGPRVSDAVDVVAVVTGVAREDLTGRGREAHLARPRQLVMHLCRETTTRSNCEIARMLGRDHSTVIHGIRRVAAMLVDGNETLTAWRAEALRLLGL